MACWVLKKTSQLWFMSYWWITFPQWEQLQSLCCCPTLTVGPALQMCPAVCCAKNCRRVCPDSWALVETPRTSLQTDLTPFCWIPAASSWAVRNVSPRRRCQSAELSWAWEPWAIPSSATTVFAAGCEITLLPTPISSSCIASLNPDICISKPCRIFN